MTAYWRSFYNYPKEDPRGTFTTSCGPRNLFIDEKPSREIFSSQKLSDFLKNPNNKYWCSPWAYVSDGDEWVGGLGLPNCTCWANGRFHEIYDKITGKTTSRIHEWGNDEFVWDASSWVYNCGDLAVGDQPQLGAIMCWGRNGRNHVAIVEEIHYTDNTYTTVDHVVISESGYNSRPKTYHVGAYSYKDLFTTNKNLQPTSWDYSRGEFSGFIYNPALPLPEVSTKYFKEGNKSLYPTGKITGWTFNQPSFSNIEKNDGLKVRNEYQYKEIEQTVLKTKKYSIPDNTDVGFSKKTSLLTYPTLVEAPFIILEVGKYTFGKYIASGTLSRNKINVEFPNYIESMSVKKVNGTVNQYTFNLVYQIQAGDDPNLLDKIFSSVGFNNIKITYGDYNAPSFIYKQEVALITGLTSNIDFTASRIRYTLTCTSNSISLLGGSQSWPKKIAKPSDLIYEMLYSKNSYGLLDIFTGMRNRDDFSKFIATDDKKVEIEAKVGLDPLSYINYLVTCMSASSNTADSALQDSTYYLSIVDDTYNEYGGTYFTVKKAMTKGNVINDVDVYEIDVGYPGDTMVMSFNINDTNSWSLLYNYSDSISNQNYVYRLNNQGKLVTEYSPSIMTSNIDHRMNPTQKAWWSQMTGFPISATLVIKGLLRPTLLMQRVRINAMFYGQKHISSGLYFITGQEDRIDGSGYRTTLTLVKEASDNTWYESKLATEKVKVISSVKTLVETENWFDPEEHPHNAKVKTILDNGGLNEEEERAKLNKADFTSVSYEVYAPRGTTAYVKVDPGRFIIKDTLPQDSTIVAEDGDYYRTDYSPNANPRYIKKSAAKNYSSLKGAGGGHNVNNRMTK